MIFLQTQSAPNAGAILGMIVGLIIWVWLLKVSYDQGKKRKIGSTWAVIAFLFLSWIGLIIIFMSKKINEE